MGTLVNILYDRGFSNPSILEFWLIFKGIETKRKNVKYVYAEELAARMVKLERKDLAIKCHQFIKNVYSEEQRMLTKTI